MPPRLKDSFKKPSPDDVKKLFNAIRDNDVEQVFSMLKDNPKAPEWRDRAGNTALMMAVINGSKRQEIIDMLVEFGADVNAQNNHGGNALARAAHFGHESTVRQLLKLGANPDMKDMAGQDACDWAKMNGHREIADIIAKSRNPGDALPPAPKP
jgi:ankyrin repeat protein